MKRILIGIGLLLALNSARAQSGDSVYYANTLGVGTVTNGPSLATNINVVLDVRKQASVCVLTKVIADGANATGLIAGYTKSVDGITYETVPLQCTLVTGNGTTAAVGTTNLLTYGAGFIKLNYITNSAASGSFTNIVIQYGSKIRAP